MRDWVVRDGGVEYFIVADGAYEDGEGVLSFMSGDSVIGVFRSWDHYQVVDFDDDLFKACFSCYCHSDGSDLCASCLHNRRIIRELRSKVNAKSFGDYR